MTMKKHITCILLSLALVLMMMPAQGMTIPVCATDSTDSLAGLVVTKGISIAFVNVYVEDRPGESHLFNHSFTLDSINYQSDNNRWDFHSAGPTGWNLYAEGPATPEPVGFEVYEGDGTQSNPYKLRPYYEYDLWVGHTRVTSANMKDVLKDGGSVVYTPKDDDNSAVLTLTNAKITDIDTGEYGTYNIMANGDLTVVLNDSNTIDSGTGPKATGASARNAIDVEKGNLTIKGPGSLAINGIVFAIFVDFDCVIESCEITATSMDDYTIKAIKSFVMNGARLTAESEKGSAIYTNKNSVTINDSTLTAAGGIDGYGICIDEFADGTVNINSGSTVTASGGGGAIYGYVRNMIAGTGWTDPSDEGSAEKINKNTSEEGQNIKKYKKVRFPQAPAIIDPKPTAKNLTANGSAQELVTAGKASGGTMQYSLGTDATTVPVAGWSASIPKGTNAGTYYVWYKAVGDDAHSDSEPACVTVKITAAPTEHTITFDLNGGSLNGQTGKVTKKYADGTVITLPEPTKDGYDFDYWEGSKHYAGDRYTVKGDHTFKAVWKTSDSGNKDVRTGDDNHMTGWITLMLSAALGALCMGAKRFRKH